MRHPIAILGLTLSTTLAIACAPVFLRGSGSPYVAVASETAFIAYDSTTQTEHFVRRGSFSANTEKFGFLVPTPSVPELAETDELLFQVLASATVPRHIYETKTITEYGFGPGGCSALPLAASRSAFDKVGSSLEARPMAPAGRVDVLKEQKVGAYDAAILKANDAEKLNKWLYDNGYSTRPELESWLKWYTDNNWIITAYKISGSNPAQLSSSTVRMSFKTDKPFYPYREPTDSRGANAAPQRLLRVFYFGEQQTTGTIGENTPWPGTAVWANRNPVATHQLANYLKLKDDTKQQFEQANWTLTEFEDHSSPRPGTDELYFRPAADQSPKERPPIIHTTYEKRYVPGPIGGLITGLAIVGIVGASIVLGARRLLRLWRNPA